jgi:hypothetical protein
MNKKLITKLQLVLAFVIIISGFAMRLNFLRFELTSEDFGYFLIFFGLFIATYKIKDLRIDK